MSLRVNLLLVFILAAGLLYGWFVLPWITRINSREAEWRQFEDELEEEHRALQNEIARLHRDRENKDAEIKNLDARLTDMCRTNVGLLDANNRLTLEVRSLGQKVVELRIASTPKGPKEAYRKLLEDCRRYELNGHDYSPPPEDLKGNIKAVAEEDNLVTINLGSDSGLEKGHTLEVYRIRPEPAYVGVVRILDVRPAEAVGKLMRRQAKVQVGDEVSSDILTKR